MVRPTRAAEIEALFAPVDVRAYSCTVTSALIAELHAEETPGLSKMAAARQAEFATARACARAALADFGVQVPIARRDGGAPKWPARMAGSISHTRGFCVAVAAHGPASVGVDVEEVGRMKPAIERRILVDAERAGLEALDNQERRIRVCTIFAAKEAFYKAHYELDPRYLGFDAVHVTIDGDALHFAPSSGAVDPAMLLQTTGTRHQSQGRLTAAVTITPQ